MKIINCVGEEIIAKEKLGLAANRAEEVSKSLETIFVVFDKANAVVGEKDYVEVSTTIADDVVVTSLFKWSDYAVDARFSALGVPCSVKYERSDKYAELKAISAEDDAVFSITPEQFTAAQYTFFKVKGLERGPLVSMDNLIKAVALSQITSDVRIGDKYHWDENSKRLPVEVKDGVFDDDFGYFNISPARWKDKLVMSIVTSLDSKAAVATSPKVEGKETKSGKRG